ncbi:hypothetical protein KY348_03680 [Candidatus Woesearchaeota archaeon]|nr:hypothetical protein [Candidatus Woesearchaeota archaeon]
MAFTGKKGNVVVLVLVTVLVLVLLLLLRQGTEKVDFELTPTDKIVTESDVSMRKAFYKGIKESMEDGLSDLDQAWFCNRVFPPDLVEADDILTNRSIEAVNDYLDKRIEEGYYENLTNVSIDIELTSSQWEMLDEDYQDAHSIDFFSGMDNSNFTSIKNNTEEYILRTRMWYLYKNIINWLVDTEAGDIITKLTNEIEAIKPCQAVNSECWCPEAGEYLLPDGVLETMIVEWEELDVYTRVQEVEEDINNYFSSSGAGITCTASLDMENSYVINLPEFDYRKGPTTMGIDDETEFDGEIIIIQGLCPCEAPPPPPECRNNFLGIPDTTQPTATTNPIPCEEAVAPPGLDEYYARFEYVGVDRFLHVEFTMTCTDPSSVMDGDRTFIPSTMKFIIRSAVKDECLPPLGPINTLEICWTMTAENVGPMCEFLRAGAQPPVDPAGLSCALCLSPIFDAYGDIVGCSNWLTFPTSNPNFFDNDDCAAILAVCESRAPLG